MPATRTSQSHPLQIATIAVPDCRGKIGVTFCPGKKQALAMTGVWDRDLPTDITAIKQWGAAVLVCLMENHELTELGVDGLPAAVKAAGLKYVHLPILDADVPDAQFEKQWENRGQEIRDLLQSGGRVLIHCKGGLGRSGTIAARLLVEFGMAPRGAIDLVRKHRQGAIETKPQEAHVLHLRPQTAKTIPTAINPAEDRAVGCLLGLAVGDALGTTLEFQPRDNYQHVTDIVGGGPFKLKPGEWTDDTSMGLCLADSLLACGGVEPSDLMERFRRWRDEGYNSVNGRCFDIGVTISQAISRYVANQNPLAGATAAHTAGNGAIMRLAPVPIMYRHDLAAAEMAAEVQSRTTHGAAECLESCRLLTRIIIALLNGKEWNAAILVAETPFKQPKVKALARGDWKAKTRPQVKSSGYVIDTLEAALWAVNSTGDFREAVLLAVNLGNDADTVGAVAGQLAGARYGLAGIPNAWLQRLAWRDQLIERARHLTNAA